MGLFNTTKKLSLTLVGLSYLCAGHATDISRTAADLIEATIIDGATTIATDIMKMDPDAIKLIPGVITIDSNDCGRVFSKSGKIFALVQNMKCNEGQGEFALQFSGDNNFIFLNTYSITAVEGSPPAIGILINGNKNRVVGPGTVAGFEAAGEVTGNVAINNANGNHVRNLTLMKGGVGIALTAFEGEDTKANHIYYNHIQDPRDAGISLSNGSNSRIHANQIHHNHIHNSADGIFVNSEGGGSTDGNQVHGNYIEDTAIGIEVFSLANGRTDGNHLYGYNITRKARYYLIT